MSDIYSDMDDTRDEEKVGVTVKIKHTTDKAYLVVVDGKEFWLPKSQAQIDGDGYCIIPEWLWRKKCEEFNIDENLAEEL